MTLPNFLIIGAMKAGTTTLYRDLLTNPDVFMPVTKEPNNLCSDDVLTPQGLDAYAALFRGARPDQARGEASTAYTKLPTFQGVPRRARRVLGPDLRLIYLVRHPVQRTISHHHHAFVYGRAGPSIDDAVRSDPTFIDYSRYAMQLQPWLDTFPRENIRIIRFEDYVADRRATVADCSVFLGVTPRPELVRTDQAFNRAQDRTAKATAIDRLRRIPIYRNVIRHALPFSVRDRIRRAILPKAPPRPDPPSPDTLKRIIDAVRDDADRLAQIMNRPAPLWDLDAH